jgi:hypothetical protein
LLLTAENIFKKKSMEQYVKSEWGKVINNNHTPSVLKLDNKNIHLDLAADAYNKYFVNVVDGLHVEYANTVSTVS